MTNMSVTQKGRVAQAELGDPKSQNLLRRKQRPTESEYEQ